MGILQFVPLIVSIFFLILILVLYSLENPSDRPASVTSYPYVVGAKPALISTNEATTITVVRLDGKPALASESPIFIVTPDGRTLQLRSSVSDLSKLKFPSDFEPLGPVESGLHTAILVPQHNGTLAVKLGINVARLPFFTDAYNFAFGPGFVPIFGFIGSIAATIYQIASARKSASDTRHDSKVKWITENMRNYVAVSDADSVVCTYIKTILASGDSVTQEIAGQILYAMILFHKQYTNFLEKTGVTYFDEYHLEAFLSQLGIVIFRTYKDAIRDNKDELGQFEDKRLAELVKDQQFQTYRGRLEEWLRVADNRHHLYRIHLVHGRVLYFAVNKSLIMTYSNPRKIRDDLNKEFELEDKDELVEGIKKICEQEFPDYTDQYLKIFKMELKLPSLERLRRLFQLGFLRRRERLDL